MSDKQTNTEPSELSLTEDITTANMKPELLASLNFSEGVAKLSMLSLKKLIISMERMGVEYVLIAQTSLLPSRTVTLKFGKPKDTPLQPGSSS